MTPGKRCSRCQLLIRASDKYEDFCNRCTDWIEGRNPTQRMRICGQCNRTFATSLAQCQRCHNPRETMLLKVYGVTEDWYRTTLAAQGGTCAYPPCTRTTENDGRALAVDHNHETNKPRGILCTRHNTTLVDQDFHRWAVDYLESKGS